ncbi:Ig-like domain-containing protein [Desulfosporosinus metallidurans]|uniref:Ig-like repeat domain protein 3 n=1 Tax=Desulfosporosinus metallidurans TaxID=1888891 RepID=A0A1Q8QY21_9FIRM|nr:Ig-like domain-containing protein [Desulfosporosinus metallidurans]OLN32233.1 Ig-like repeat domain protein 3 [Desulfosporosinus metallidurans]
MSKYSKLIRLVIFLVLASLLLTGCWNPYNPGDDDTTDQTARTFAISDVYPYPGGANQIQDKLIDQSYTIYIYIINNGNHVKGISAENVKLTLIDETHLQTIDVGTTTIDGGVGYAVFNNLTPFEVAKVHLHVEGYIYQNKNKEIFAAVNSNSFNINNPPPVLQSITIAPANSTVQVGLTQTFTATANYSDGSTKDVSNTAVWSSSDVSKATMTDNSATGIAAGTCLITATIGGKSGTTNLTVAPPVLQSIMVTPTNASVQVAQTQTFTAMAYYSNGSTMDVSHTATWSSSNQSVATMTGGVATGVAAGTSTIKATYQGKSGTTSLTVTAPVLQLIMVTPTIASVLVGQTQTFIAMAYYSNGSTTDVSHTATWSSSNQSVATMTGGVATGVASGSSTIKAVFGGQSGTSELTVVVPPNQNTNDRLIWEQEIVEP